MKIVQIGTGRNLVPLTGYLHEYVPDGGIKNLRPSVIICPGGAYRFLSWREGDPVALYFLGKGYNVFILEYSVKEQAKDLNPLCEASDAVVKIRLHATQWLCDPNRIAILGFSAGAHVAASLAILHDHPRLRALQKIEDKQNRPDACILCYPVITTGQFCHEESAQWVSGGNEKDRELLCLEKQVTDDTPPTFIWHTVSDGAVPVENSMFLVSALRQHKIPFELHLFANGGHGLSMCNQEVDTPHVADHAWVDLCTTWLADLFEYEKN
ncbi:MAG: alpha/beta hydrolase [Sphaerochaetaceae bacterium]